MYNRSFELKLAALYVLNLTVICGLFFLSWILYYNPIIHWSYQYKGNITITALFLLAYILFLKAYGADKIDNQRKIELILSQTLSVVFADIIMYLVTCLLYEGIAPVYPSLALVALQTAFIFFWVIVTKNWYLKVTPPLRAAILHDGSPEAAHLQREMPYDKKLQIVAVVDILDCIDAEFRPLENIEVLFICTRQGSERDAVVEYCTTNKLNFYLVPTINDMILSSAKKVHMFHMPMLQMHIAEPPFLYAFLKRTMDIVLSLAAILVLWPFMLIIAAIIRAYDGGPALYRQARLTKDGKVFKLIKFRTMRVDAEADGVARLSTGENDSRITPVGKFLRKMRLDELPQLFNILGSDMSIVGPRPERPEIAEKYEEALPEFRMRLQVKAGLTGYAQIYGKYNSTPKEKLEMDMIYISNPSITEDLRLILTTIRVLFIKDSTEGFEKETVEAGTTTAAND